MLKEHEDALPISYASPYSITFDTTNTTESTKTYYNSKINIYVTIFVIFVITLLVLGVVVGIWTYRQVKLGKVLANLFAANSRAMGNFVKVINVDKSITENSQDAMEMPMVTVNYQPTEDPDPTIEYKLQEDKIWEFSRKNVRLEQIISEGAMSVFVKARAYDISEKDGITTMGVKMLKTQHSDTDMINLVVEMEILKRLKKHENILRFLGCCTQGGPLLVITEYASRGNLYDFLVQYRSLENNPSARINSIGLDYLSENMLLSFANQISIGMEFLSSQKCVHRDLATRNIFVSETYTMKIGNFGLARNVHINEYCMTSRGSASPIKWMAPESLSLGVYTTKSDVWSFGIVLWEIETFGETPYASIPNHVNLFPLLQNGLRLEQPLNCSDDVYFVMSECWKYQPTDRPSFSDLVKTSGEMVIGAKNKSPDAHKRNEKVTSQHLVHESPLPDTPPTTQESTDYNHEKIDLPRPPPCSFNVNSLKLF